MGTDENVEKYNSFSNNCVPPPQELTDDVLKISQTIDENNVIDGAREIIKIIRPSWTDIKFKLFTDGITNKLVGCFNITSISTSTAESPTKSQSPTIQNDEIMTSTSTTQTEDVVLVRVYGNKTDLLIDRKAETKNIQLLHKYGYAPNLYAVFENGLAYEYVPGVILTIDTILIPKIWKLIARRMAEMHKVDDGCDRLTNDFVPSLLSKTIQFLDLLPEQFTNDQIHERIVKIFPSISKLRDDFTDLYKKLVKLNSPIVFAHNDLLLGNVIYTEQLNRVTFIDYEYASYNFQAFDIGNHFTEFVGIDEIDYSRYPSKEFQLEWLREYLKEYNLTQDVENDDVEKLYVEVNQFSLASHYLWTLWALIQAEYSTIDFDFVRFAENRYNEYLAKKDQFLSLEYKSTS